MPPRPPLVYLDHAATTPVRPEVVEAMLPYLGQRFGNPSGIHSLALESRRALDEARETVARCVGARHAAEIVFTAGGTEADNLAVLGIARALRARGDHLVTTRVEHHAVLHACDVLEKEGFRITRVPVDEHGRVDPEAVLGAVEDRTVLISVMLANNEVGTLQPVAEIARRLGRRPPYLHTDAVQAVGVLPLSARDLGVDALALSAHKFHGPKGVGALYLRGGTPIVPLIHGGGQEQARRAGTENVPGVVGMATALSLACREREDKAAHLRSLRDRLIQGVLERIPGSRLTGHPRERHPGIASFVFEWAEGESILMNLDRHGIAASTGSACSTATLEPSHVLLAMGIPVHLAHGSVRFSLGRDNTPEEVDRLLDVLPGIVARLRELAPRPA